MKSFGCIRLPLGTGVLVDLLEGWKVCLFYFLVDVLRIQHLFCVPEVGFSREEAAQLSLNLLTVSLIRLHIVQRLQQYK